MSRRAWLTVDSLPASYITLAIKLPADDAWRSQLRGALVPLMDAGNFESFGALSVEQMSDTWRDIILEFFEEKPMTLPAGMIAPFAGGTTPDGWLLCDGSLLYITDYPELFAAVQWIHGGYDGNENRFKLPDLRGRMIAGMDAAQAEFQGYGQKGGAKSHTLTVGEMPAHNHVTYFNNSGAAGSAKAALQASGSSVAGSSVGGGASHNNLPPYMALNYIIKT